LGIEHIALDLRGRHRAVVGAPQATAAYYWRAQAGAELDLPLLLRNKRIGIEIKWTDAPTNAVGAGNLKLDRLRVI
jgi:hypothetical protein